MPSHTVRETGIIDAVFAHRFVLARHDGTRLLADLGPQGAGVFPLLEGDEITIEGEAKPSELKVSSIARKGGEAVAVVHGKPHGGPAEIDPATAVAAVARAGLAPVGEPRRKPRHFEVLARRGAEHVEVHVGHGGTIRKEKPAGAEKWADALADAT